VNVGSDSIAEEIAGIFQSRGYGGFQKVYPAQELRLRLQAGDVAPDDETLDNFGALFERATKALNPPLDDSDDEQSAD
jgi:hypothetical protein